jgi:EmrB/QacA subfamily drug resistance transporter
VTGRTRQRAGLTLALLAFSQFIIAVDYNIVYVALPDIGHALGFSARSLQWVVSAYAVAFGGFLLLGGRVVDRIGGRRVFALGLAIFGLACLAGGLAHSPGVLIAARAVQGFGAALLAPATLALINTRFTEGPARTRAFAVWGASGSGGLAVGAVLGGVLTQALGWQWVLYVLVPLAALAIAAIPTALPPDNGRGKGSFDVPGAVLATAGSSLLVLGLVSGPDAGWGSPRGAGAIAAGVVLLGLFALVEVRTREPLVPMRLLGNRSLATSIGVILVFQSSLGGAYFLLTNYLQGFRGYDALQAGLSFLPLTIVSMIASLRLAGALLTSWGPRWTLLAGMAVNGIGLIVLALAMSRGATFWELIPGMVIWGVGGGTTFPAMFACAASGVAPHQAGVASALASAAQQIGGAAGLAVLVVIATAARLLADGLRTAMWMAGAASLAGGLLVFALRTQRRDPLPDAEPLSAGTR